MSTTPITVIVHTRNRAALLQRLLDTIQWADETIVVDMASDDNSVAIAHSAGARVLSSELHPRIDGIRNRYLAEPRNEWIFVLDSDEYVSSDAPDLVSELIEQYGDSYDAFAIPRFNKIGAHVLRGSGWYPDSQTRLFRKGTVRWSDTNHGPVEVLTGEARCLELKPPNCLHIHHDNYTSLEEVIERQAAYALSDVYPDNPDDFLLDDYIIQALWQHRWRDEPEQDGDLSRALAIVMAWDKLIRGVIHWNRLSPRPPLPDIFTIPIVLTEEVECELKRHNSSLKIENAALKLENLELLRQLDSVQKSTSWRITAPLRALKGMSARGRVP